MKKLLLLLLFPLVVHSQKIVSNSGSIAKSSGLIVRCSDYTVSGNIYYSNGVSTPYANKVVSLNGGGISMTTTTDGSGNYTFYCVPDGNYTVDFTITTVAGGWNSTDALLVMYCIPPGVGCTLVGLYLAAADVDGDSDIDVDDVNWIVDRYVHAVDYFPAGDWCYEDKTVTVAGSSMVKDIGVVCYGDVNGTYIPPF